jgi:hypothetical protein
MLIGKLFIGPIRRSKTAYAVTNQRIIIFSGISKRNIKSVTLDALNDMSVSIRKNGKGTIRLGNSIGTPWNSRYTGHQYYLVERSIYVPEFEMIEDVKMVYDLIKKLKNEKKSD